MSRSNPQSPSLSVLMPVYNGERYLAKAIESILTQTYSDLELVVVNDGSTDGSQEILGVFAKRDPRLRVIEQANSGIVAALNLGLAQCTAPWVARMDADDIALPQRIEVQMREKSKLRDCVALGSRVLLIDPEGLPIGPFATLETHEEIDAAHLQGYGGAICHPSVLLNKHAVLEIGGYRRELAFAEDIDLFLRLAEVGRIANVPEVLLHYRLHVSSIGYTRRAEQLQRTAVAVSEAHTRRGLPFEALAHAAVSDAEDAHSVWAWWAIQAGNLHTARHHAWCALRGAPLRLHNWKTFYCAVRGR